MNKSIASLALIICLAINAVSAIEFTGNAKLDFSAARLSEREQASTQTFSKTSSIKMSPLLQSQNRRSGVDIDAIYISYDDVLDTLFVGVETASVLGDVDGSRNPGLVDADNQGVDVPNMCGGEYLSLMLWLGLPEEVVQSTFDDGPIGWFFPTISVGVPINKCLADLDAWMWDSQDCEWPIPMLDAENPCVQRNTEKVLSVTETDQFTVGAFTLGEIAKPEVFNYKPSIASPHLEFKLTQFSKYPGISMTSEDGSKRLRFALSAKSGSTEDKNGEDTVRPEIFEINYDCSGYPNGLDFDDCVSNKRTVYVVSDGEEYTTGEDDGSSMSTGEETTGAITTGELTTGVITTGEETTGAITTGELTTGSSTTGHPVSTTGHDYSTTSASEPPLELSFSCTKAEFNESLVKQGVCDLLGSKAKPSDLETIVLEEIDSAAKRSVSLRWVFVIRGASAAYTGSFLQLVKNNPSAISDATGIPFVGCSNCDSIDLSTTTTTGDLEVQCYQIKPKRSTFGKNVSDCYDKRENGDVKCVNIRHLFEGSTEITPRNVNSVQCRVRECTGLNQKVCFSLPATDCRFNRRNGDVCFRRRGCASSTGTGGKCIRYYDVAMDVETCGTKQTSVIIPFSAPSINNMKCKSN